MSEFETQFAAFISDLEEEIGTEISSEARARIRGPFSRHGGTYSPYLTSSRMGEIEPPSLPVGKKPKELTR
jgi:hypothetical protein